MKKINLIGLLILASSLFFIQCTSDPIPGPQGEAGVDGTDGTNGVDGVDGTASCVACHSKSHRDPINETYALSGHATGTSYQRGTSASCAQCHGEEGYLDYITKGAVNADGYTSVSPMSCTTCHDKHSTFDFDNDGHDFALRSFDPVWLVLDPVYALDFEGTSNNCATCHQPRNSYAVPGPTDDYTITSYRFGPHHGPQATLLEGVLAANISGSQGYPGSGPDGDNAHRKGASCVSCHMGETTDGTDGLHSWTPTEDACASCHGTNIPTEVTGFAADFQTLHDLLINQNYIDSDGYVLGGDGTTRASSTNPLVAPAKVAQAIWNYKTLEEDKSNGVHNPKYSKALLKNSIEALQN
ncbi:MAG: cytochrome c3 family protein [Flavobacteriaceae bacterium]